MLHASFTVNHIYNLFAKAGVPLMYLHFSLR